jgi:hypothetical protein
MEMEETEAIVSTMRSTWWLIGGLVGEKMRFLMENWTDGGILSYGIQILLKRLRWTFNLLTLGWLWDIQVVMSSETLSILFWHSGETSKRNADLRSVEMSISSIRQNACLDKRLCLLMWFGGKYFCDQQRGVLEVNRMNKQVLTTDQANE